MTAATERLTRPAEILLIEDNEGDIRLTQEVLKEGKVRNHLSVVRDGEEAMAFLRREGRFTDAPQPDLILLDLNLPRKDGRELLTEIKQDPRLRVVPVVVLTTSNSAKDVMAAYENHTNCYICKPVDLEHFINVIRSIESFWLRIVTLPSSSLP